MSPSPDLARILPRVLIVSRRTVRKNKFVDFVGEYHLDLIVGYGAVPVIVPRVAGVHTLLDSFEPIHGVLLCEGEDVDPSLYGGGCAGSGGLSAEQLDAVRSLHPSDAAIDHEKDSIELRLARRCLERNIPFLGICRGSQVLNVACGGTLYQDVDHELPAAAAAVRHINYDNYDGAPPPGARPPRHAAARVVRGVARRRGQPADGEQLPPSGRAAAGGPVRAHGVRAGRPLRGVFRPRRVKPRGRANFIMGLQFHPERMRKAGSDEFDYPGCPMAYQAFVRAVVAYQEKLAAAAAMPASPKLNQEMEKQRKVLVRSFSLAKNLYVSGAEAGTPRPAEQRDLDAGAEFLEQSNTAALSVQQEKRLKQMGATVRNASGYINRLKLNEEREAAARALMAKMSIDQLSDLASFYHIMGTICSEVLDRKLHSAAPAP
ncbi:hypothetical protein OsJ_00303 [Oryza sativa Japonica Group]|uniref:Uncharacterized protein n=1 Tax=Oryza sativa subsp. japonica TaxID=39947 RepID=B9EZF0_ORYSJ|nr:hypothetical protein OsJ_00303 [Oryza sativa Japonica Group]